MLCCFVMSVFYGLQKREAVHCERGVDYFNLLVSCCVCAICRYILQALA